MSTLGRSLLILQVVVFGSGPRTTIDLMLHGGMIVLLVTGLIVVGWRRLASAGRST
jgi:hypothetical protein